MVSAPVVYFGVHPLSLPGEEQQRAETPIGKLCLSCREAIQDGDSGLIVAVVRDEEASIEPIHVECQALGVVGHDYGICTCTGHDTGSRAAALELWEKMGQQLAAYSSLNPAPDE